MPPVMGSSPYSEVTHSKIVLEITNQENEQRSQSAAPPRCAQTFTNDLGKDMDVITTKFLNVRIKILRSWSSELKHGVK